MPAKTTKKKTNTGRKKAPTAQKATRANTAATKAKGGTKASGKAKAAPAATRAKSGRDKAKRTGVLDAAAAILAKAKEPMSCKAIVEKALAQKLWATSGKTPHATLYSAIIREITNKGKQSRFEKTARGRFQIRAGR